MMIIILTVIRRLLFENAYFFKSIIKPKKIKRLNKQIIPIPNVMPASVLSKKYSPPFKTIIKKTR
nr:hypothetical protein [Elizabethkingia sp. ASV34]